MEWKDTEPLVQSVPPYTLTSTSFIFVSLKTFHEELKTSSFVFLSPVSCSSAQPRSCYNKNVCGDEDLHFEIGDCSPVATVPSIQSLLVPPAYLILISRQSFKPPTVQISLGETNYSAAHSQSSPGQPGIQPPSGINDKIRGYWQVSSDFIA